MEGNEYQFRIVAENKVGEGHPGPASQPITAKDPWEKPGRPGIPEISAVDRSKISLKWAPPKNDGGSPIFNYVIEYRVEGIFLETCQLITKPSHIHIFLFSSVKIILNYLSCFYSNANS